MISIMMMIMMMIQIPFDWNGFFPHPLFSRLEKRTPFNGSSSSLDRETNNGKAGSATFLAPPPHTTRHAHPTPINSCHLIYWPLRFGNSKFQLTRIFKCKTLINRCIQYSIIQEFNSFIWKEEGCVGEEKQAQGT